MRDRFADLADSDFPLVDDAYATIDVAGTIDGEAVEGLTASDFLYRVGSGDGRRRARRPAARHQARRDPRVHRRRCPSASRELAGRDAKFRVIVKEAKQKVLARAHRRVGGGGERVRDRRRAARRHPQAGRDHAAAAGADGVARQGARRRGRPRADRSAADARRRRDAPAHRRSRPPALASGREPRAVPRDDRTGTAGVHRRDPGRRGSGGARRSRAARGRRAGRRHCERRRGRRRGAPARRAQRAEGRQGATRARTEWCAGGGTL